MQKVSKPVIQKGNVVAVCECDTAESWDEAVLLAGGEIEAISLFNSAYITRQVNKLRPQRSAATGARKLSGILKRVSPEVQAALNSMDEAKLVALLEQLTE
jgi:hypothetical protein